MKQEFDLTKIGQLTMTSLEIADLTGKRHDHVLRDIRVMFNELFGNTQTNDGFPKTGHTHSNFEYTYIDPQNKQEYIMYKLNKHYTYVLVTGYSIKLRDKVIERWTELEEENRLLRQKLAEEESARIKARNQARLENPAMNNALKEVREEVGKDTKFYHYSNEADMINRIVLGMTAAEFKIENDVSNDRPIRDLLNTEQISAITTLQKRNTIYIEDGLDYQERKERLTNYFNMKFKARMLSFELLEE